MIVEMVFVLKRYVSKNISYVAFLDGSYPNILLSDTNRGDKLTTQRKEIKKYLLHNPQNFWVNTRGFECLFRS